MSGRSYHSTHLSFGYKYKWSLKQGKDWYPKIAWKDCFPAEHGMLLINVNPQNIPKYDMTIVHLYSTPSVESTRWTKWILRLRLSDTSAFKNLLICSLSPQKCITCFCFSTLKAASSAALQLQPKLGCHFSQEMHPRLEATGAIWGGFGGNQFIALRTYALVTAFII